MRALPAAVATRLCSPLTPMLSTLLRVCRVSFPRFISSMLLAFAIVLSTASEPGGSSDDAVMVEPADDAIATPTSAPSWRIPKCNSSARSPRPSLNEKRIPVTPCGRTDLQRNNPCSLLATYPVIIPASLMANAKLYPERRQAITASIAKGGHFVEVGTLNGQFAKWMLRSLLPASLTVMDISTTSCFGTTAHAASQVGAKLRCQRGASQKLLKTLNDSSYDLIYVDADHDYAGVCSDLEAARTKVKPGGFMALNDYYRFEWQFLGDRGRWGSYGVMHAANEFLVRYGEDWEVAYYTFGPTDSGGDLGLRRLR